ncbi:hypothetical protein LSTR_LSTR015746 [Laodelphax striatellus]|uniref:Chitin-binding type-2 domain-containing protein n=1 Tax=Laodelphax striatellus TaxID=195883 RepID=A0A482WHV0_LAOST|nr:hypothetical protein LSTR_LSTR015746 [Laodelphax striatellus]
MFFLVTVSGQQGQKNQQEDPCKVKNRVVADASYCDRYWECVNGQPELYDCPNGLVYAGKNRGVTEGCDYPWRANYCEDKTQANGPIGREHCDWLYGIFGHETSCTRYWTCWNGTATEQLCIGGLLYNENTHSCDWPENVDGCQKHREYLFIKIKNSQISLLLHPEYWQCQGGYPRLQRCPAMLVFDRRSLRCVVPPTEDCEVPTTPAPAPGEEDDGEQNPTSAATKPINGRQQQNYQQHHPSNSKTASRASSNNLNIYNSRSISRSTEFANLPRHPIPSQGHELGIESDIKAMTCHSNIINRIIKIHHQNHSSIFKTVKFDVV